MTISWNTDAPMRSELDVLLDKVADPALRADICSQVDRLRAKRTFGLVFESHLPERVRLPEHEIRVGVRVAQRDDPASAVFEVTAIKKGAVTLRKVRNPDGSVLSPAQVAGGVDETARLSALVVIADFGEPVFPGLRRLGGVSRGGQRPAQVVIKGENHHVLEALQFTHAGKVDCIYIDPPYNSGARDWKYDNNYVDDADTYRHSKWLAMMERRIRLAKELLNPEDSVLIVTIDEKEYLRLGLLLEQLFPRARTQMVTTVINHSGVARGREFYRADEYLFFVFIGEAAVCPSGEDMLNSAAADVGKKVDLWRRLLRSGTNARRQDRPNLFYPFWIDPKRERIHSVGDELPLDAKTASVKPPAPGLVACWPIRLDDSEGNWQIGAARARRGLVDGTVRLGAFTQSRGRWSISYIRNAEKKRIERGEIEVTGKDPNGALILAQSDSVARVKNPVTVWNQRSHNAGAGGSNVIRAFLPGRRFPFPKSLYAVEDALRFFVANKPEAVVLDFFGGSGTTAHAVLRLNREDGGRRQSIVITNNEVSPDEAEALRTKGLRPGDPEWEALGIFEYITRPRVTAAITGRTPSGEPVEGDYKFSAEFPMADGFEENVEFFELTYLDPEEVELDKAFNAIAPLLWLRAGARGPIIDDSLDTAGRRKPYAWTERYGVLFNSDRWRSFVGKRQETASTAFIVTDSQTTFAGIASELPVGLDVVRLYENYLSTFAINRGYL
jgi:adenine-specific DNA-methyltransferase